MHLLEYRASVDDSRLLRISKFRQDMEELKILLHEPKFELDDFKIKHIILGDSVYMLKPWLLVPYQQLSNMPENNRKFNDERWQGTG